MGYKKITLPLNVPVRLVTMPGSGLIRIELEGPVKYGFDPDYDKLYVFDDPRRRPVKLPLSEFQTHALRRELVRHTAARSAYYAAAHRQERVFKRQRARRIELMRLVKAGAPEKRKVERLGSVGNVVFLQFRQSEPPKEGG